MMTAVHFVYFMCIASIGQCTALAHYPTADLCWEAKKNDDGVLVDKDRRTGCAYISQGWTFPE